MPFFPLRTAYGRSRGRVHDSQQRRYAPQCRSQCPAKFHREAGCVYRNSKPARFPVLRRFRLRKQKPRMSDSLRVFFACRPSFDARVTTTEGHCLSVAPAAAKSRICARCRKHSKGTSFQREFEDERDRRLHFEEVEFFSLKEPGVLTFAAVSKHATPLRIAARTTSADDKPNSDAMRRTRFARSDGSSTFTIETFFVPFMAQV